MTNNPIDDGDDLLAELGVVLPAAKIKPEVGCGGKPPRAKQVRHTEWNNLAAFTFGGYLALVHRTTCKMCDRVQDTLQGIFLEEIHLPSGTRRLQQLGKGAQWPMGQGHRKEVHHFEREACAGCVADLGFDREVDGKGQPFGLWKQGE